jgi:hypothetical protein
MLLALEEFENIEHSEVLRSMVGGRASRIAVSHIAVETILDNRCLPISSRTLTKEIPWIKAMGSSTVTHSGRLYFTQAFRHILASVPMPIWGHNVAFTSCLATSIIFLPQIFR